MLFFLVGFMGSGKSYWASKLSEHMNISFMDLDRVIAQHENCTISEYFIKKSEKEFRKIEHKYLSEVIQENKSLIVACGGGTPCFHNNMDLMKKHGKVIYLQASLDFLLSQLKWKDSFRPLTQTKTKQEFELNMQSLFSQRMPYYLQADKIIDISSIDVNTFARILTEYE